MGEETVETRPTEPIGPTEPADGPRWLNADEHRAWRAFVLAMHLLDTALDQQLQRDSGLPHAHYMILVILSESPDRQLRMSDLARDLRYSPSRMSHAVASLERNGWIERRPTPNDRRGQLAVLTAAGFQALAAAAPSHVAEVRARVFDQLTPEQVTQLGQICDALLPGLEDR